MIEKIKVKNYQSLYDVEVKLGKFTVLYGNSDVGKSAFYRAIRGLLTGEDGDDFISVGTNRTGVSIKTTTGSEIVWTKTKGKSSTYFLFDNGTKLKEWNRARRLPSELADRLQIKQLLVDSEAFYPNLRGQFDPLFLLFESPSKRARILGSLVSNLLLSGIKAANIERNRNEADIRAVSSLAEEIERKMEIDWKSLVDKATALETYALSLNERYRKYNEIADKFRLQYLPKRAAVERLRDLGKKCKVLLSDFEKVLAFRQQYEKILPVISKFRAVKNLQSLDVTVPSQEDTDRLFRIETLLHSVGPKRTMLKAHIRDVFLSTKELEKKMDDLGKINIEIEKLEAPLMITCPHCGKEFKNV